MKKAILIFAVFLSVSCKKETVETGSTVVWFGQNTAQQLTNNGVTSVSLLIDGKIVASSASDIYFLSEPNCGQGMSYDEGILSDKTYPYVVQNQNNVQIWAGTIKLSPKSCSKVELVW